MRTILIFLVILIFILWWSKTAIHPVVLFSTFTACPTFSLEVVQIAFQSTAKVATGCCYGDPVTSCTGTHHPLTLTIGSSILAIIDSSISSVVGVAPMLPVIVASATLLRASWLGVVDDGRIDMLKPNDPLLHLDSFIAIFAPLQPLLRSFTRWLQVLRAADAPPILLKKS
jgi:hypothetical protein